MNDSDTTLAQLKMLVRDFVRSREWEKYHRPKNLAMSIAIEAAELMEHVQWLTIEQSRQVVADRRKLAEVGEV